MMQFKIIFALSCVSVSVVTAITGASTFAFWAGLLGVVILLEALNPVGRSPESRAAQLAWEAGIVLILAMAGLGAAGLILFGALDVEGPRVVVAALIGAGAVVSLSLYRTARRAKAEIREGENDLTGPGGGIN